MKRLEELITRCVDCTGAVSYDARTHSFRCGSCPRTYAIDTDGVLDAFPRDQSRNPLPAFYRSDYYKKWLNVWAKMLPNWVIYSSPLRRYFSLSGHREVARQLKNRVSQDSWVVDLGCGRGDLFNFFDPRRCIGIDGNRQFLVHMKKLFPEAVAIHADFTRLPFGDGALECVVSLHVLEHLYYLAESLEETGRVTGPNGVFIFCVPTEGGIGWELGRALVTGPHLRRKYQLDVQKVMMMEHINDARRILRMMSLYYDIDKLVFRPFPWIRFLFANSSITGVARWNPSRIGLSTT